jgi:hypothetical protein
MPNDNSTVEWREVPGFSGYRASNDGRIETQWIRYRQKRGNLWVSVIPYLNKDGYQVFNIPRAAAANGVRWVHKVHVFVCLAFHGLPESGQEVRHFPDNCRTNNRADNLSWATHLENLADQKVHGTTTRGERSGIAKLTVKRVRQIRRLYKQGYGPTEIAKWFGVDQSNVSNIVAYRAWAWLDPIKS